MRPAPQLNRYTVVPAWSTWQYVWTRPPNADCSNDAFSRMKSQATRSQGQAASRSATRTSAQVRSRSVWVAGTCPAVSPAKRLIGFGASAPAVVPSSSWPASLPPQQDADPSWCRAQEWAPVPDPPELTLTATAPEMDASRTGRGRSMVVPSPTWPTSFLPQQETPPSRCSTQAWSSLAETSTASLMPTTRDPVPPIAEPGSGQWTAPSAVVAQIRLQSTETDDTAASPWTLAGASPQTQLQHDRPPSP